MDEERQLKLAEARTESIADKIMDSLSLSELIGDIAAAALRMRFPDASEEEIDDMVVARAISTLRRRTTT